jgi:very-short-patch-repair endonuclease
MTDHQTRRARELRHNMTDAERTLWRELRRTALGARFRRQAPVGQYIVDFACLEARLIVEVDGGQHAESRNDERRDRCLASQGFRVLRFWNNDVLGNMRAVLEVIVEALKQRL